jgi:outer membrane lipoprotein-sorting protein
MTKFKALIASFIVAILFFNTACTAAPAPSQARQIIDKMVNAIGKHTGVTFTMDAAERLISKPSEYNQIEIFTKINVSPLKIYGKVMKDPNKGTELLYVTGQRDNKIRVNPGKFLPTMTLAPTSGLLTKNQHHTLLTSGFMIVNKIVTDGIKRADARGKFDEVFKYAGDVQYKNRNCYKIVMGLAKRLLVSEYHIMELNPGSRGLDDDISGKTIKVPTSYAKKTILYIDKENNFPIYQEMSDDKGVFEKYEYSNLVVNPAFKADEFSEKFSEYKF